MRLNFILYEVEVSLSFLLVCYSRNIFTVKTLVDRRKDTEKHFLDFFLDVFNGTTPMFTGVYIRLNAGIKSTKEKVVDSKKTNENDSKKPLVKHISNINIWLEYITVIRQTHGLGKHITLFVKHK